MVVRTAVVERNCTLLLPPPDFGGKTPPTKDELKQMLESKDVEDKKEALKIIIQQAVNGDDSNKLLMHVIRYCLTSDDHYLKRLTQLYWEVVEKYGPDKKLLPEMILVCNHIQRDLEHANEYIRGSTLRLITKIHEAEVLEPVIPHVLNNLTHRHSYVRKNAVLAVYAIFQEYPDLIPDAPSRVETFLQNEHHGASKRNAFIMLSHCDQAKALDYLNSVLDNFDGMDETFQLAALEFIRKVYRSNIQGVSKSVYLKCVAMLLQSSNNTVAYEAANTLLSLSSLGSAKTHAISTLTTLLTNEGDQNVKIIILDRLAALRKRGCSKPLENSLMDILRVLSTPNNDIRKKALDLAMDLTTPANIEAVVGILKKEIVRTESADETNVTIYRKLLVESIHKCAEKFPDTAAHVVQLLLDYLGDSDGTGAAMDFVKQIAHEYPKLRQSILDKLLENFSEIRSVQVYERALWILGSYCDGDNIESAIGRIRDAVGELPLGGKKKDSNDEKADDIQEVQQVTKTVVLADGTYATAVTTATEATSPTNLDGSNEPSQLRILLEGGNYFLCGIVANSLTKLCLRLRSGEPTSGTLNASVAQCLLIMTSMLRLAEYPGIKKRMDSDSRDRIRICLRMLLDPNVEPVMQNAFIQGTLDTFSACLVEKHAGEKPEKEADQMMVVKEPDAVLSIRQLKGGDAAFGIDEEDDLDTNIMRAVGNQVLGGSEFANRLERVHQLTGLSDPVYAEAVVTVHQFDIVLDILVINQTGTTMQNLTVELQTSGDLKLVESPKTYTLGKRDRVTISTSIKVSSTETGVIFGNIVYNKAGASLGGEVVVLNGITMDIIDYIRPAKVPMSKFCTYWAELEWENKIPVNTNITDPYEYLDHIQSITNMSCLSINTRADRKIACQFLAVNLYAQSIFGEDALLNLSVQYGDTGKISGYIRIRSKTQGIALSLGDKITHNQRDVTKGKKGATGRPKG